MKTLNEASYAMTFEEIALVEGISRQGAFKAYQSAVRKLRRKGKMPLLVSLASELERHRHSSYGHPRKVSG